MRRATYALIAAIAALAALDWLHAQAVRWVLRRNIARLHQGDLSPMLATYADDVRFTFPGHSSWAGEFRGKDEVGRWLARFARVGLRIEAQDILLAGPPWNATVCVRFIDRLDEPGGDPVYENRGTIAAKLAWGKIVSYEVNEDTEKVAALDPYLEARELGTAR